MQKLLFLHNSEEVGTLKVVPVFHAEARVHVLLRENADCEGLVTAIEAALEFEVHGFRIFPKQYVYPRFCMEHRKDFKRANFLRIMQKK